MDAMDLIAFKVDPTALPQSGAAADGGRAGRARGAPGAGTFADILAASEASRRRDAEYARAYDESGMDELEEESLLDEEEEEKSVADDESGHAAGAEHAATVTQFLPLELRPQPAGGHTPAEPGLQGRLLASTAGQALSAPAQAATQPQAAAQAPAQAPADTPAADPAGPHAALAGAGARASWRQDAMAEAAVRRGDKREALIQAPSLGTVFGKGTAPGNLILAAGGQVGVQGQNGQSGTNTNLGGQNGQAPTQSSQPAPQAAADPAAAQARSEQFAAAMAAQAREPTMRGGQAPGQAPGQPPGSAGIEALRSEPAQAGSQQGGQTAAPQAAGQAEQPQRAATVQQQQAPQAPRAPAPQPAAEQVAVRIAALAKGGMDQIRIQLEPADLGRVDIRLHMQDGAVTAVVTADRQETLDLLQRDSRSLQQALQDAGLKSSGDGLSFSLRDDGRGAPAGGDGKGSDHAGTTGDEDEAAARLTAEAAAAAPQWRSDRALDIVA